MSIPTLAERGKALKAKHRVRFVSPELKEVSASQATLAPKLKHVALFIESTGSYGRGLLQGIAKYNRERGGWSTYFRPHSLNDAPPNWLKNWRGDGLLVRIETPQMLEIVRKLNVPTVNLRNTLPDVDLPYVSVDNAKVAQLAYEHLADRGLREFAFCGRSIGGNPVLQQRQDHFCKLVETHGGRCHIYNPATQGAEDWEDEQANLCEWISRLPRPIGIMACNDERGLQVLDAARRIGVRVPDDVAVIGVDNDEALCELSIPPLTSIDVNAEAIGYHAAGLLDQMMNGATAPTSELRLPPRAVVTRRSTDVIASEDEDVAWAVRYIRANACRGLRASDVFNHLGMGRTTLQERMKRYTGRTVHGEIQHVRLQKAQNLLATSDLTIKQVARESGFSSVQYLTRVFRAMTGETPAGYRNKRNRK